MVPVEGETEEMGSEAEAECEPNSLGPLGVSLSSDIAIRSKCGFSTKKGQTVANSPLKYII